MVISSILNSLMQLEQLPHESGASSLKYPRMVERRQFVVRQYSTIWRSRFRSASRTF